MYVVFERNDMRALLVVDVQTDVIRQGQSAKGLIEACNDVIARYEPENVVYIVNKLPWESASKTKEFVARLSVVSNLRFDKKRGDAFSNPALLQALRSMGADSVEIIGADGNHCIKATALGALRNGLSATVNIRAVSSRNERAFDATKRRLRSAGVGLAGA